MSFFKKLTDTAKSTANTLSSKSQELYTAGRLKIEQTQIEGKIKDKKTQLGDLVYKAFASGLEPGSAAAAVCEEIKDLERQVAELDQKMQEEQAQGQQAGQQAAGQQPPLSEQASQQSAAAANCPRCGAAVEPGGKFCPGCGGQL
ncbi:zinc ribbon domain-containing protein [Phosphitispora fastidiosa]|uniref:zinc ribbon domain-containing protein n=1 Tax=Phosphitispora fastidiosa TaxID=2837202 RepID=UPI001E2EFD21|nr:zinc ribbon domain-containing protein [Phosphitispora fastidiosa]MBU7008403.1 membrane protease subunit (stomatin/prohibitin family) [Phosphitispora fastidiosa]